MPDTLWLGWPFVALVFVLAGFVKGVVGLGLPTVAIGLLAIVMSPAEGAALVVVPSLVTNIWQLLAGPAFGPLLRRLWPMLAGVVAGTWLGAGLGLGLASGLGGRALGLLGIALVIYAGLGLARVRFEVPCGREGWLGPLVGLATGIVTAATGVFVIPAVPYLGGLRLAKDDLVQALGLSFTVSTLALAATLMGSGLVRTAIAGPSLVALAAALLGMTIGGRVRERVGADTFRRVFFLGLGLLGAHLVYAAFA